MHLSFSIQQLKVHSYSYRACAHLMYTYIISYTATSLHGKSNFLPYKTIGNPQEIFTEKYTNSMKYHLLFNCTINLIKVLFALNSQEHS